MVVITVRGCKRLAGKIPTLSMNFEQERSHKFEASRYDGLKAILILIEIPVAPS